MIEDVVGFGGMGIVYAARDSVLDRDVALKVLRPPSDATADERAMLEREARAMARLSHPNVVTIFDVGELGSYFYLAMELIDGGSLAAWLERGQGTEAVMRAFLGAGRGLEAAHRAGIIHGDFKPGNVLVGEDGSVRVTDFGLAVRSGDVQSASAIGGTPRYLAPERRCGGELGIVSDVFSYCAALQEALGDDVPASLSSALLHGLAQEQSARAPNLDEILARLEAVVAPRPRWRWWSAVGGLAVVGIALVGVGRGGAPRPCESVGREFDPQWNAARRSTMEAHLAPRAYEELDAYATQWTAMRAEVCAVALERHDESMEMMMRKVRCLEDRKRAFDAVAVALETPGLVEPERAVRMAVGLPSLAVCVDHRYVSAEVPPPVDLVTARGVDDARAELARVRVLLEAPDLAAARRVADSTLEVARALRYEPLLVEALDSSAQVFAAAGEYDAALADADAAYERADGASRITAAEVHAHRGYILEKRGEFDAALREAKKGRSIASTVLGADHPAVARHHIGVANRLLALGRTAEALEALSSAANRLDRGPETEALLAANVFTGIGAGQFQLGNYAEAAEAFERALAIAERRLGVAHPEVGKLLSNLGGALYAAGKYEAAGVALHRALEIREASLGPNHPSVANVRVNLGLVLEALGDTEAALAEHRAALAVSKARLGESHPEVAEIHVAIGLALDRGREHEAALAELELGRAGLVATLGSEHRSVAEVRMNIGTALLGLERDEEALEEFRGALSISTAALPPSHPSTGRAQLHIGTALRRLGRSAEAVAAFQDALGILQPALGDSHPDVERARDGLALALRAEGQSPDD